MICVCKCCATNFPVVSFGHFIALVSVPATGITGYQLLEGSNSFMQLLFLAYCFFQGLHSLWNFLYIIRFVKPRSQIR
jgi:hypothetical protein